MVDHASEITKAKQEVSHWKAREERSARFMVDPDHADSQHVFAAELARAAKQRRAAGERLASFEKAQAAENATAGSGHLVRDACRRVLRGLGKLKREQWAKVLQLLLKEVRVTGRTLELHGILPIDSVAGRSQHEDIVRAGRGHFKRTLGSGLSADVLEI